MKKKKNKGINVVVVDTPVFIHVNNPIGCYSLTDACKVFSCNPDALVYCLGIDGSVIGSARNVAEAKQIFYRIATPPYKNGDIVSVSDDGKTITIYKTSACGPTQGWNNQIGVLFNHELSRPVKRKINK